MFDFIKGSKKYLDPLTIVVEAPNYGWKAFITKDSFIRFSDTDEVKVYLYIQTINDSFVFFGFATEVERTFFKLLISVSGVGPKLAIRALAHISYTEIYIAIVQDDVKNIVALPGIGQKTAQKIILELKDKVKHLSIDTGRLPVQSQIFSEAFMALENFGFESSKIKNAMSQLEKIQQDWVLEDLIRNLLQIVNKK